MPSIPGDFSFKDAKKNAEILELGETKALIIGYEDLIKNKNATNRPKDQIDIQELAKRKNQAGE